MEEPISNTERIFVVRKNAIKMIIKRGYVLKKTDDMIDYDAFVKRFGTLPMYEDLSVVGMRLSNKKDRMLICFNDSPSIGVSVVKEIVENMQKEEIASAVIIIKNKASNYAKIATKRFEPVFHIDLFSENDLLVDITEHFLVPPHILLSEAETKDLLERLCVPANKLPKIDVNDPVCRYYGFKPGQVIKIIRDSLVGGRTVAFRVVM